MLSNFKIILKSKLFYSFILIIFLIPFVYERLPVRIDITQQSSLPQELWITYSDISLDKDYVLFTPPQSKYITSKDVKYLKKIACKEDDWLRVDEYGQYYCNNNLIGRANKVDGNNKEIENFKFNGTIPKDKIFVVGTHPLSHDSKYFGFVDKTQIIRKATPLF